MSEETEPKTEKKRERLQVRLQASGVLPRDITVTLGDVDLTRITKSVRWEVDAQQPAVATLELLGAEIDVVARLSDYTARELLTRLLAAGVRVPGWRIERED